MTQKQSPAAAAPAARPLRHRARPGQRLVRLHQCVTFICCTPPDVEPRIHRPTSVTVPAHLLHYVRKQGDIHPRRWRRWKRVAWERCRCVCVCRHHKVEGIFEWRCGLRCPGETSELGWRGGGWTGGCSRCADWSGQPAAPQDGGLAFLTPVSALTDSGSWTTRSWKKGEKEGLPPPPCLQSEHSPPPQTVLSEEEEQTSSPKTPVLIFFFFTAGKKPPSLTERVSGCSNLQNVPQIRSVPVPLSVSYSRQLLFWVLPSRLPSSHSSSSSSSVLSSRSLSLFFLYEPRCCYRAWTRAFTYTVGWALYSSDAGGWRWETAVNQQRLFSRQDLSNKSSFC